MRRRGSTGKAAASAGRAVERLPDADDQALRGERLLQEGIRRLGGRPGAACPRRCTPTCRRSARSGGRRATRSASSTPAHSGMTTSVSTRSIPWSGRSRTAERLAAVPRPPVPHSPAAPGRATPAPGPHPRPRPGAPSRCRAWHRGTLGDLAGVLVHQHAGEADLEARALPRRAVHPDVPAALHHDAVHRGETEAGVEGGGLGGEERLEEVGLHFGRHALARVAHDEQDVGAGGNLHAEVTVGVSLGKIHVHRFDGEPPPCVIASRAFRVRFITTCSICP